MKIALRFFASVREELGTASETLALPEGVLTVRAVRELLQKRGGVWASALADEKPLRMAFNQVICIPETVIQDGGEVAFFPPVTGG